VPVSSPSRKSFERWRLGVQVDRKAEAAGEAYALIHLAEEEAAFDAEERIAPAEVDAGLDRRDHADALCLELASPCVGERDPNADVFDRYTGCFGE
jgi:hypothetical protein